MMLRHAGPPLEESAQEQRGPLSSILECLTEAATDGILAVGTDGLVLTLNRACREMWSLDDELARPGVSHARLVAHFGGMLARPRTYTKVLEEVEREPLGIFVEQLALRDGREVRWTSRPIIDRRGRHLGRVGYYADVTRLVCAERDALAQEARTRAVVEGACDAIVSLDDDLHILDFNGSAAHLFGWSRDGTLWQSFEELAVEPAGRKRFVEWLHVESGKNTGDVERAEFLLVRQDGKAFSAECAVARRGREVWVPFTLFARDVSVQKRLEAELRQAQKLESVGRLASGIAHEINTPMQFVGDSLHFIRESVHDLIAALERCMALRPMLTGVPGAEQVLDDAEQLADLAFLSEHAPKALDRAADGLERVATLVQGMKEFAHPGAKEKAPADLNHALQSTLTIARNEFKLVADLETHFGDLPKVTCLVGEINQAFLNIVVNAAHAIADVVKSTGEHGRIEIRTWREGGSAFVSVRDTGGGIPEHARDHIFEPFFTTKEVG
ncbi:MAG: PAS domain S-box protein, partial [Myxococcales bacterium]|nr:PAS domain S-box protein [Myxococcales bacterium]